MKRLVLLGEGYGDVSGLPVLVRKLIHDKNAAQQFFVDQEVIRAGNPAGLVKWDKVANRPDDRAWVRYLKIAAMRPGLGGILAVFDGDADRFPAGSPTRFCAAQAAKLMADSAAQAGAGKIFSLAIVFACVEYETWLANGVPSLATAPTDAPESRGKGWIQRHRQSYRPTRDQRPLTEQLDLALLRSRNVRSFDRMDHAVDELFTAAASGACILTPA